MIQKLLEQQDLLFEIAVELYGEDFLTNKKFWNSPTEIEMREIQEQLLTLGHSREPSDEEVAIAQLILDKLKQEGLIDEDMDEEDEEDTF